MESPDSPQWMRQAIALATENVKNNGGGPFGAIVVRGAEQVAHGVNQVTSACDPTAHAEIMAIRHAAAALGTHDLSGCELFSSCEPCPMCLGAILWSRLDRVFYGATQQEAAAAGFDDSVFYQQMSLAPDQRIIPMILCSSAATAEPFAAWHTSPDRIRY